MLPKQYRKRYVVIFLISLLLHVSFFVYLIFNPVFEHKKEQDKVLPVLKEGDKVPLK